MIYSKTCLKRPLKRDKTKFLMTNGSLMKVTSIAECSKREHSAILIGLENQILVLLRVAVLDKFYCIILQENFYLVYPSAIASVASCKIVQTKVSFNK